MTNINRATQTICDHLSIPRSLAAGAARALSDDGLLAHDLPRPTHRSGMGAAGSNYPMSGGRFARVHLRESDEYLWTMFNPGSVTLIHNQGERADAKGRTWPDTRHMRLAPDAAREIAYTLLAAADNAEGGAARAAG